MWFNESQVIAVLRSLRRAPQSLRAAAFSDVITSRRRDRVDWESTNVASVFTYDDAELLVQIRDISLRVCAHIHKVLSLA